MGVPLFEIHSDADDIEAVREVIDRGSYWANGPEIEEFEEMVSDYLNTDYCSALNSGGSAGYAVLKAHGVGEGDEVIVPSFTFVATAFWPLQVGAKPVFADIEEETLGLDPEDVRDKITEDTEAIYPIHYGGMPCKIRELKKIAEENDIVLIEDAAESFGAKLNGNMVGTFGDSAILSFCQNKIFSTGEGGAVVTDDEELQEEVELIRSYGRKTEGDYFSGESKLDYVKPGQNLRMATMNAALGISQMEKVDKLIEKRREKAEYFNQELAKIGGVKVPEEPSEEYFAVYQLYTIRVPEDVRDNLMDYLDENDVASKIYFEPVHHYSAFEDIEASSLQTTEKMSKKVLSIPIYPDLDKEEMDYIIETVKEFFEGEDV